MNLAPVTFTPRILQADPDGGYRWTEVDIFDVQSRRQRLSNTYSRCGRFADALLNERQLRVLARSLVQERA